MPHNKNESVKRARTEQGISWFDKHAESLMETIIAVTVIALGMTGAAVLVRTSMSGNESTQERFTALSHAREGIEAIDVIRNTNYLRYDGTCWNSLEGTSTSDCGDSLIEEGSYYALKIDLDSMLEYSLKNTGAGDSLFDDFYRIWECAIESPDGTARAIFGNPIDSTGCFETGFYRYVYTEYDTDDPETADSMTATVVVGWVEDGDKKMVEKQAVINK